MPLTVDSVVEIRWADAASLPAVKRLLDAHRQVFAFVRLGTLVEACKERALLVALAAGPVGGEIVGFVRYHHRKRDGQTTLYELCVASDWRRRGIGRRLVDALVAECRAQGRERITLKCPQGSEANHFYANMGFTLADVMPGKRRTLNVWMLYLPVEGETAAH